MAKVTKNGIKILDGERAIKAQTPKSFKGEKLIAPLGDKIKDALRAAKKAANEAAKAARAEKAKVAAEKRKDVLASSIKNAKELMGLIFPWVVAYPEEANEEGLIDAYSELAEVVENGVEISTPNKTIIKATGKSRYKPDISRVFVKIGDVMMEEDYIDSVIDTLTSNPNKLHKDYETLDDLYEDFPNIPVAIIDQHSWYGDITYTIHYQIGNIIRLENNISALRESIIQRIIDYKRKKGRYIACELAGLSRPELFRHYNIDPKAFKYVDNALKNAGIDPKNGYDSNGVWGLSPAIISQAWYNSGCKLNGKFKTYIQFEISNLVKHGRVDGCEGSNYIKLAGKKESSTSYFFRMKGEKRIRNKNIGVGDIKRIGRLHWVTASYALKYCLIEDDSINSRIKRFKVDWAKVAAFSKLDKFTKASYLSPKLAWFYLFNRECPFSISKNEAHPVFLAKDKVARKTWMQVAKMVMDNSTTESEKESNLLAAYNLVRVFRDLQTLKRWLKASNQEFTAMGIHDSFVDSKWADKVSNLNQWVTILIRFPDLSWSINTAPLFEKEYNRMPKNKKEFVEFVSTLDYKATTPLEREVGRIASKFKLGESEFKDYVKFFNKTPLKPATMIPAVEAVSGDYRMVKLDDYDKVGPFLGLATDCCQHLHNAASSCAKAGYKDVEAGFYVVYKGEDIIAQSFVWRANDGSFVFDSIEGLGGSYNNIIAELYQEVARKLIGKLEIHRVLVGDTQYGITSEIKSILSGKSIDKPVKVYKDIYTDASNQWIMPI